jgi:PAS domain S-box-containing protein
MRTPSAKAHIAFGQVCLLTTLLLAAELLGFVPDRDAAVRQGRVALVEAIAANGSSLLTQGDIERLEATLRVVVERNDDILSASVRRASGRPVVSVGDHDRQWREIDGDYSSDTQLQVALFSGGRRWGRVELRFRPLSGRGWLGGVIGARSQLIAVLSLSSLVVFYFYLGRMLRHLDPSQAVPTHVRSALDTLAEGLMVLDLEQRIVLANHAFASIVGSTPDELLACDASDLDWVSADGTSFAKADLPWARALAGGDPQRNDMLCLRDSASVERTFIVNCSPVLGSGGEHAGVLISLDDVTQLEEHKAELHTAKEEAEAANEAKSEFLANMSHEIRTPMNAILGFTEVLMRGYTKDEADRRKHLGTIRSSGRHLVQLINDVLDLSKVESGRLEIERIRFAPHGLIQEVISVLSVKAREKRIELGFEVKSAMPETILSDPTRLRQIVTNLVSNAIKFTGSGGVRIVARVVKRGADHQLRIDVVDSGIGVAPEKLELIFEPFAQADASVTRRFGGTGLGLHISRRFARLLGGDVTARSTTGSGSTIAATPGSGSTFTVTLDTGPLDGVRLLAPEEALRAAQEAASSDRDEWQFPPARILIVDDGDENRELVQLVLEEVGLVVESAENGLVGVELARQGRFDVILMDVQMPVMDGFTATSFLREEGLEIPIIALTGNVMKGYERECAEVGFSGHVTKPIDIDVLFRTLADWLGVEPQRAAGRGRQDEGGSARDRSADEVAAAGPPIVSRLASNPRLRATIAKFVHRLHEKLEAMEASWEVGDLEELASLAHWLKGSAGTVGFDAFSGPAKTLEILAKEGKEAEIDGAIQELRGLAERIALPGDSAA